MDKLKEWFANPKVQAAIKEFGRAALSAFVVLVVALVAVINGALAPAPQGGIGALGLQPVRHDSPETFNQAVTFKGAVAATAVSINGTPFAYGLAMNTATPQPTATLVNTPTPATNVNATAVVADSVSGNTGVFTTSMSIAGTPIAWGAAMATATPQPTATAQPFIVRGGTVSNYNSAEAITHGFSAEPLWCSVSATDNPTSTLYIGSTTFSATLLSAAVPLYWQCGKAP